MRGLFRFEGLKDGHIYAEGTPGGICLRATRAYIASLGTTGILLAASVAMLLVVSALVAFDGWSRGTISDDVEQLFVADDRPDLRVSGPAQAALDAAPAARAVASRPARTRTTAPTARGRETRGTLPTTREGDGNTGGGGDSPVRQLVPVPEAGVPPVNPDKAVDGVSQTTRDTAKQVGDTVSTVSPTAGQAVTDTGEALSEIVDSLPDTGVNVELKKSLP